MRPLPYRRILKGPGHDQTRIHFIAADAFLGIFQGNDFGQVRNAGLGNRIHADPRHHLLGCHGIDIQDLAALLFPHILQGIDAGHDIAAEVCVDDLAVVIICVFGKHLGRFIGRVVDQDIDPAVFVDRGINQVLKLFLIQHIGSDKGRLTAIINDFLYNCLTFFLPSAAADNLCAMGRKQFRHAGPDAGSCTGDDYDFILEFLFHTGNSSCIHYMQ